MILSLLKVQVHKECPINSKANCDKDDYDEFDLIFLIFCQHVFIYTFFLQGIRI